MYTSGKYGLVLTPQVTCDYSTITRGNDPRLKKSRIKYDLLKYYFTSRALNVWNSLPNWVALSDTVNTFENRIARFWHDQHLL